LVVHRGQQFGINQKQREVPTATVPPEQIMATQSSQLTKMPTPRNFRLLACWARMSPPFEEPRSFVAGPFCVGKAPPKSKLQPRRDISVKLGLSYFELPKNSGVQMQCPHRRKIARQRVISCRSNPVLERE